ncbi:MAG: hypothetical protein HEP71_24960 [Roseivirga sp.]|nr:hypothetical protein [Roseivirga sp.]
MKNSNSNKQVVLEFYKNVIGKKDTVFAERVLTDNYIQHNPMIKTGKSGLIEAIEMLKQIPTPENPPRPFMRLIAEGDLVAAHMMVEFNGLMKVVLDLFRLENGLIAEHWDAIQDVTAMGSHADWMIDGPVQIEDRPQSDHNKSIVENWCQQILIDRKHEMISIFVSADLTWHSPEVIHEISDIGKALEQIKIEKVHLIMGEGNFVVTQSTGTLNEQPHVFYDIHRLENGKLQEHWSVSQAIPAVMAHENGMI